MSEAIQNHLEEHRKKETSPEKGQAECDRIEDLLITQILEVVGQE